MALVLVRHASLYVGGAKVAEMYESTYDIASGDEPQYGDLGFLGMSDGAITTKVDATTIVTVPGNSVNIENMLLQKQDVDVTLGLIDGHTHQITMRCTNANFKSDAKAGTLVGSFSFMGGPPSVT